MLAPWIRKLGIFFLLGACGPSTSEDMDASMPDAGNDMAPDVGFDVEQVADSGADDAGARDAGSADAVSLDVGSFDASSLDAASLDAGSLDAGFVDGGAPLPSCEDEVTIACEPGVRCVGTTGDDVILGTAGADTIDGLAGNDTICALSGDDIIEGGAGHDFIVAGAGADTVRGGQGWDQIYGGDGNDSLEGGTEFDILVGGEGDDWIAGGAASDLIEGNAGDDTLFGGPGVDYCFDAREDTVAPWGSPGACEYLLRGVTSVEYATPRIDGVATPLLADLYECEDSDMNCHGALPGDPPLIYAHGGGFRIGSRLDMNPRLYAAQLASMGFRVMNIDYRVVGRGSGRTFGPGDFSEWGQAVWTRALAGRTNAPPRTGPCASATAEQRGAFELGVLAVIEDVLSAAEFARVHYGLAEDESLILSGSSAGAISSFYAAYAVDDLELSIPLGVRRGAPNVGAVIALWGGFFPTGCPMNMDADWMEPGEAALYVVHGEDDTAVDASYSRIAVARAEEVGLDVVARFLPGVGHGFPQTDILSYNNNHPREVVRMRVFLAGLGF
ncbi:MAG: hypothetical protein AB8H86_03370 [Polyangiales bacterium]